jgi:hypothetical protein
MRLHNEVYIGDGLYLKYDGFAVWLRAPREGEDHIVALEPDTMANFIREVLKIERHAKIVARVVHDCDLIERRKSEPQGYDTTAERDMDRESPEQRLSEEGYKFDE